MICKVVVETHSRLLSGLTASILPYFWQFCGGETYECCGNFDTNFASTNFTRTFRFSKKEEVRAERELPFGERLAAASAHKAKGNELFAQKRYYFETVIQ